MDKQQVHRIIEKGYEEKIQTLGIFPEHSTMCYILDS